MPTDAKTPEQVTTVAIPETNPLLRAMVKRLTVEASFTEGPGGSSDLFVMDLMEGILTAGAAAIETADFDAIFEAQESGMVSGKDFTGRPFFLKGEDINFRPASPANIAQGGFTHYAIMKVYDPAGGDEVTLNCGGKTFMAVLDSLMRAGYFLPEKGCPDTGRCLIIIEVPSPAGAYLKLQAFKMPETPSASTKKKS